jgi:hypothetical protein
MACGTQPEYWQYWTNGQVVDGVLCPLQDATGGMPVLTMLLWGGVASSLYIASNSFVIPFVWTLFVGVYIVALLPTVAMQVLGSAILLAIAAAGTMIVLRTEKATA